MKAIYFRAALILILLSAIARESKADIVYLKNGRSIEGLIKSENEKIIEIDVGFGTVKFSKDQVGRIEKSTPEEISALQQEWRKQELKRKEQRVMDSAKAKTIEISQGNGHMKVDALINKKVDASLIVDTGSSLVLLSNDIAKKLKIDTDNNDELVELQLADGSKIDAKHAFLESISVQGVEVKNIEAAFLLKKIEDPHFEDGLLGMSFLDKFNFRTDKKRKKLILEKLP